MFLDCRYAASTSAISGLWAPCRNTADMKSYIEWCCGLYRNASYAHYHSFRYFTRFLLSTLAASLTCPTT